MAMKKTKKEVEKVKEEIFSKLQDLFNSVSPYFEKDLAHTAVPKVL